MAIWTTNQNPGMLPYLKPQHPAKGSSLKIFTDQPIEPAGAAIYPLADGRICWAVVYGGSKATGTIGPLEPHEDYSLRIIRLIKLMLPSKKVWLYCLGLPFLSLANQEDAPLATEKTAKTLAYAAKALLPTSILRPPLPQRINVPTGLDSYTVATDGSAIGSRGAWAYVTGGGWYATGEFSLTSLSAHTSAIAEWVAINEALRAFPARAQISLIIDNEGAASVIKQILKHSRTDPPPWLPREVFQSSYHLITTRTVCVIHIARNSEPIHKLADRLCGKVRRGQTAPTTETALIKCL